MQPCIWTFYEVSITGISWCSGTTDDILRIFWASLFLVAGHMWASLFRPGCIFQGIIQPDMWGVKPSDRWDWGALRAKIAEHGIRNSLLVAPMPTASTSQILGNNECFEPYTSNIYSRRVLRFGSSTHFIQLPSSAFCSMILILPLDGFFSGEFVVVNKHLLHDLTEMGLWSPNVKNRIIHEDGSVQNIPEVPEDLKRIYKYALHTIQR